jgi:hypothetical protein
VLCDCVLYILLFIVCICFSLKMEGVHSSVNLINVLFQRLTECSSFYFILDTRVWYEHRMAVHAYNAVSIFCSYHFHSNINSFKYKSEEIFFFLVHFWYYQFSQNFFLIFFFLVVNVLCAVVCLKLKESSECHVEMKTNKEKVMELLKSREVSE